VDLESYLTTGARRGFVDFWSCERESESDVYATARDTALAALRERSMSTDTPAATLRDGLIERGTPADEAAELVSWLGGDAALLLAREVIR
jgi:SOS response regulatory protein OraA/RecX